MRIKLPRKATEEGTATKILKWLIGCVGAVVALYTASLFVVPGFWDKLAKRQDAAIQEHKQQLADSLGEVHLTTLMRFSDLESALRARPTSVSKGGTIVNSISVEWYNGLAAAQFMGTETDLDPRDAGFPIILEITAPLKGSIDGAALGVTCAEASRQFQNNRTTFLVDTDELHCESAGQTAVHICFQDKHYITKPLNAP